MKRREIDRVIAEELARIPRGELSQNILRSVYNMTRRHDLASNPGTSRAESLARAVNSVRHDDALFVPAYDASFFQRA